MATGGGGGWTALPCLGLLQAPSAGLAVGGTGAAVLGGLQRERFLPGTLWMRWDFRGGRSKRGGVGVALCRAGRRGIVGETGGGVRWGDSLYKVSSVLGRGRGFVLGCLSGA